MILTREQIAGLKNVKINLGGEGERSGYVNVNPLQGNHKSQDEIAVKGDLVIGTLEDLPSNCATEIVSQRLPSLVFGANTKKFAQEILRVLNNRGTVRLHCQTVIGSVVKKIMEAEGFSVSGNTVSK